MNDYSVWYIYYVSRCAPHCYYYCSTADPGPEGGRCVGTHVNGIDAHKAVRKLNQAGV